MGSSIVGKPTCASTEPSTNSTNACTTDCGCTTTSTAGYGNANRKCASITSSALLTRVAESTVIFFPMRHVGWRSASSDRKSTRLNSSHLVISYAVFCLKKKKNSGTVYQNCTQAPGSGP